MAWNPDPKVRDVAELAKKWGSDQIIVLAIDQQHGTFGTVSYGKNLLFCSTAKRINEQIHKMVADGTIEIEP